MIVLSRDPVGRQLTGAERPLSERLGRSPEAYRVNYSRLTSLC